MKKKLVAFLLAVVMIASMLPISALALADCIEGEHDWRTSGSAANGYRYCYKSGCDVKCYHEGTLVITQVVNCMNNTNQKWVTYECSECHYSYNGADGVGVSHVFDGDLKCLNCLQTHSTHSFDANGNCTTEGCTATHTKHEFNTNGKCNTAGCTAVCEHDYQPNIKECGTAGAYNNEVCSICKNTRNATKTPAKHDYVDGVCTVCKKVEPTCDHKWGEDGACVKGCGETCPHEESELDYRDCVESQYDHEVCKACGVATNFTVTKERTTHTYENGVCSFCGKTEPKEECKHQWKQIDGTCELCGVEHEHDYKDVMPNCTYGGYHTQHCAGCKHTIIVEPVDSKNHIFGDDGVCTVCGAEKTDCDHEWNWATAQCKLCGEFHIHSEDDLYIDHPDCTEGGYVREICEVCGHILVKSGFEPMDHDYNNGVCTRCGHVKPVDNDVEASTEGLDDVPATGDNRFAVLTVAAVVVLFGATAILFTKKRIAR